MILRKPKTILLGIVSAALTAWQPAMAGFSQGNSVTLGGKPIFQMASAGGFSAEHRAWLTQDALDNALVAAADRSPAAVTVARANGAIAVMLDGRKVATVDANSANDAGMSVGALADKWAQSLKDFLADQNGTALYLATLKDENDVAGKLALIEKRVYAPAGFSLPISLSTEIISSTCKVGDSVQGAIDSDVVMGNYVIPAGTVALGELFLANPDRTSDFSVRFTSLRTPNGTIVPIDGVCTQEALILSQGPHRVCTYAIPSGMANGMPDIAGRVPAAIGVGTLDSNERSFLVFTNTSGRLAAGTLMNLQLENVTRVAVVMRHTM